MSGGHFDYQQFRIEDIATEIDELIARCEFKPEVIERFKIAAETLRLAEKMAHRVDYLVCGDDGEVAFMERWDKEIEENKASGGML